MPDATLRSLTGYRLQRASTAAMLRYKAVFQDFGLRRTTFSCLSVIVDNPGLRQSQLGDALAIERPNLVQMVDDLVQAGFVTRATSETDRRAYALRPTPKGLAHFSKASAAVRALDAEMTAGLGADEVTLLKTALAQVERNAAARSVPAGTEEVD